VNWVDLAVLAVIAISALLAFMRGLVREVMGIGAWVGAGIIAIWAGPELEPRVRSWLGNADFSSPVAYAAAFLVALILLSFLAHMVGTVVRGSLLGGIDRTLGVVFGVARGALLIVVAYIAGSLVMAPDRWPEPVRQARALPYAYQGAAWLAAQVPLRFRPVILPPLAGRPASATELMRLPAAGRPTDRP
jgi:membrane protein required for colicin V production